MEKSEYIAELLQLSQTLNSSLNLDEVLKNAIDSVVDFVKAERGFIMLFDYKGDLEVKAYKNIDPESIRKMEGLSKTIIKQAAEKGECVLSLNAQQDPRFKNLESVLLSGMRSVMCVPLRTKEKIIGVIYLDNRVEEGMFKKEHLSMLVAFANQAANAIENAKLHENLKKTYESKFLLIKQIHQQEKEKMAIEEANRLKSEFVNIVSHELRSPLTVIKTYTNLLHQDAESGKGAISESMKKNIYRTIDREVDRLLNLINKLLDVSRIDAGRPLPLNIKPVNVEDIVNNVVMLQSTSRFYKPNHSIKVDIPPNLPPLECDPEKLTQILMNLVENALKYSPDGGEVKITVRREEGFYKFSVSDEGMGMCEEDLKKLFQKFERFDKSNRSIPGTGLGLYLIKHLIELHGGKIYVESKPQKGSKFTFFIPIKACKKEDN